jgi:hypothetical protein
LKHDDRTEKSRSGKWDLIPLLIAFVDVVGAKASRKRREQEESEHNRVIRWWTRVTSIVSIFAVFVAGVAACFFYGQLRAMEASNSEGREGLVAVQRAFVFPGVALSWCDQSGCLLTPRWENSGTTPTKHLILNVNRAIVPFSQKADTYNFPPSSYNPGIKSLIGPHGALSSDALGITRDDLQNILEQKNKFWLWGSAKYRDVFDGTPEHITCFAYEARPVFTPQKIGNGPQVSAAISSFSLALLSRHNCADADCEGDPCEK